MWDFFAYAEGRIGRNWWNQLRSESAKRDLPILWLARNAFVHADSKLIISKHVCAEQVRDFEDYCTSLQKGALEDDKGNIYSIFMSYESSTIRFNKEAINQFRSLFEVAFQAERLGRLGTK